MTSTETTETTQATEPTTKAEPTGAPEAYADYKSPEGHTPDAEATKAANAVFKEIGLTQEQAQKVMNLGFERDLAAQKAQSNAIEQMKSEWGDQLKTDKTIGGKLDVVKADIGKALSTLDPTTKANFQTAMDATGVGNHPAFVKAIYELAQKVNEGKHVGGNPPAAMQMNGRPSAAQSMYSHLPSAG